MKRSLLLRAGFTLLEIMLVVLIIGLLIGMAIRYQGGFLGQGQQVATEGAMENVKTMLLVYQANAGTYPTTEQGLKALINKPESEPKPRGWRKLADQPVLDGFKREFFYEFPGKRNADSYDLYSAGNDGKPGTPDDIGNWVPAN